MELLLDEGRVYGSRYYTVEPMIEIWFRNEWRTMVAWCVETYGPTPEDGTFTPGARWYANDRRFWFRNEADRTMFILRWS